MGGELRQKSDCRKVEPVGEGSSLRLLLWLAGGFGFAMCGIREIRVWGKERLGATWLLWR